ncbi:MAG: hypothetical protein GXO47_09970 [Chlorobi bacterium]|nr:hypothetical protein [Chlorobiota bacterium]
MKKIQLLLWFVFAGLVLATAQDRQTEGSTAYRSLIPEEKQSLLKNVDMIANTQMGFRNDFNDGDYIGSNFKVEQFRFELKGYIHENIFFRFRHRYTSTFEPQSVDKIIKGVDMAYVRFDLSDKWQLSVGKMCADWGGVEFDLNPIDIYEYSDIIEMADNFLTGAGVYYQANENNGFALQLLDSRTGTFEELYDTVPNVTASKVPLAMVFNWRGKFLDGKFSTIWSYSLFTEAKGMGMNYIALGNQFRSDKLDVAYDFKISFEDLDRTGIISNEIPDDLYNYSVRNTVYRSHWTRVTYKMSQKWHFSLDAFIDCALWKDDADPLKNEDNFRTVYSVVPTVELFPFKDYNLKFFLGYVGRWYNYSDYAKNRPGLNLNDYSTSRIMIGLISPLHIM